ncbi:hypothetical protein [Pseudomonas sp.]|uniref:hypothetical protein n=1 Tax=Pseudomonas sp. TaxID=306 RepID=UPI00262BAEAD|nr:hypothetical protein [Pseudomonas sp.]
MDELLDLLFLLLSAADSSSDTFAYASACAAIYWPDESFHQRRIAQSIEMNGFTLQNHTEGHQNATISAIVQ